LPAKTGRIVILVWAFSAILYSSTTLSMLSLCQSNLIGSKKKIDALRGIIDEHSIGTSKDSFTNKRTINGDADKYRELATKGATYFCGAHSKH
jgi:hypothetical protein